MSGCQKAASCCSCLFLLAIIALSVFGIISSIGTSITPTWDTLENDLIIQSCIQSVDINVDAPDTTEVALLPYCSYAIIGLFFVSCCLGCCFKDSENFGTCIMCFSCLLVLIIWGAASILLHVAIYIYSLNEEFDAQCAEYDHWKTVYLADVSGGLIAIALVIFQCCACYMILFMQLQEDTDDYVSPSKSPPSHPSPVISTTKTPQFGSVNNERTVAIRNNNYNDYDDRASDGIELTNQQREVLARVLLSAELIEQCGFSIASTINKAILLEVIKSIKPDGSTALRDAVALGVVKMLSLKLVLNKLGVIGHQFIHIVLTDGLDNSSQSSLRDIQDLYQKIGNALGSEYFKTFFVGIGLGSREKGELQSIADLAGDSAELFNCNDVQLSDVFERIKVSLGINRRVALVTDGTNFIAAKQDRLFLQAERQKFLVLFDLDMSGSMNGHRWNRLQGALGGFFSALDDSDIIGCVLFNEQAVCITGEVLNNATK